MVEKSESARLTMRVTRRDKDGQVVSEERETECPPEELARHLGAPWEVARHTDPPEQALQALEDHLLQSLLLLECAVTEDVDEQGRRTWAVVWRRPDPNRADQDEHAPSGAHEPSTPEAPPQTQIAERRSRVHLRTDNGEPAVRMRDATNALNVLNTSFCGVNWGNAYGVFDLHMEVHIHPPVHEPWTGTAPPGP